MRCECRDECQTELRELRLTLKSIESQQKTLMSNIDDDIYIAVKHVYDKVYYSVCCTCCISHLEFSLILCWFPPCRSFNLSLVQEQGCIKLLSKKIQFS